MHKKCVSNLVCFTVNVNLKAEGVRQKMYCGFRGARSLARNDRTCIETIFLEGVWGVKAHCSAACFRPKEDLQQSIPLRLTQGRLYPSVPSDPSDKGLTLMSSRAPAKKKTIRDAIPMRWLPVARVTRPISAGPRMVAHLPTMLKKPKNCPGCWGGIMRA